LPNGELRYTRDGAFALNSEGLLVTKDGYELEGATVQLDPNVSPDSVTISADGRVTGISQGTLAQLGDIQLYRFVNPAGLSSEGGNLYAETPASGSAEPLTPGEDGIGTLRHRFLEGANVEVVRELVALITAQRAYEINSRAIRAGDEMLSATSQIVR
jgi:flagellar basal-body rod protein FlgG